VINIAVVKNLMVRAGADFSGLKKEIVKVQKTMSDFKSSMSSTMKTVGATLATLGIGKVIKDSVKGAMEVESSIQQIKRIMGESSNQFLKWANDQAIAFNMGKQEALKYGSVYGNLISGFTKSTGETMKYTEELLKSSSIVASATGRNMEDVMERIRSGLLGNTEAIEDLGVYAQVAMLKSTDAFKKYANGKSWEQLDYQTQQQIRLMSILEQVNKKYGDSVNQNTNASQQRLIATLKNVQLSLGQAFLPIYQTILPALISLAQSLAYVMNIVAQFSQALFGKGFGQAQAQTKVTAQQAGAVSGLGDAYKGAGQKAKGALASFDEINSLSKASSSGGGGGASGGLPTDMPTGPMPLNFETNAAEVSAKIQGMVSDVKGVLAVIFEPFKKSWELYGPAVMTDVNTIFNAIKTICIDVGTTLYNIWTNPAIQGSVIAIVGIFTDLFTILARIFDEVIKPAVKDFLNLIDPTQNPVAQWFCDGIKSMLDGIKELTNYLAGDGFSAVKGFLDLFIGFKVASFLISIGMATTALITNAAAWVANSVAMAVNFVASTAKAIAAIYTSIAAFIAQELAMSGVTAGQYALNLAMSLNPIGLVVFAIAGLIAILVTAYNKCDWFRNLVNNAFDGIKKTFSGIVDWFKEKWDALWNLKIPKIPMPHFKMKGEFSLAPPSIPSIGVDWYDKGGVFNSPSVIGVGEKRPEFVGALEDLRYLIGNEMDKRMSGSASSSDNKDVILMLNEIELGRATINAQNRVNRIAGDTLQMV
jgi:hypothetical protein